MRPRAARATLHTTHDAPARAPRGAALPLQPPPPAPPAAAAAPSSARTALTHHITNTHSWEIIGKRTHIVVRPLPARPIYTATRDDAAPARRRGVDYERTRLGRTHRRRIDF